MRTLTLTFFLCLVGNLCVVAQPQGFSKTLLDSLEKKLATLPNDTSRINTLIKIVVLYSNTNVEKSILLGEEALKLSRKLNYAEGLRKILAPLSFQYSISGQWAKGLELALEGKERYKDDLYVLGNYINMAKLAYEKQGDYKRCLEECHENIRMFKNHPEIEFNPVHKWASYMTASQMYSKVQQSDSALIYAFKCLSCAQSIKFNVTHFVGYAHNTIGIGYLAQNKPDSAIAHLHIMHSAMEQTNNPFTLQETQIYLANAMQMKGVLDSMHYYAKMAYDGAAKMGNDVNEMNAALILSEYFEKSNPIKSLFYLKRHNAIKEKLFTQDQTNKRYFLESEQRKKLVELEKKEINAKNRIRQNALLGGLFTFILLAGGLIYTNRRKKLLNDKLQEQKLQIENQNQDLVISGRELALKNRDLEIEGALEKIRSTSLSMRHSSEIKNVVTVLFEKLKELNLVFDAAAIHVFNEGSKDAAIWVASPEQLSATTEINLPFDEDAFVNNSIILDVWHAKETGKHIFNKIYPFEEKNRYFNYVFKHNSYEKIPEFVRNVILNAECYTATFIAEKNSLVGVNSWIPQLFSEQDFDILKRIARVFEQAYVRFLDLQKAEAQARESQIEAAVERVRAQSMAMHNASDLQKVNEELLLQLNRLKIDGLTGVAFYLVDPDEIVTVWDLSSPGNMGDPNSGAFKFNSKNYPILGEFVGIWKEGKQDYFIMDFPQEKLIKAVDELQEIQPEIAQHFRNAMESGVLQHQWNPTGRLTNGILSIDMMQAPSEDTKTIVLKMAGAFNMAYQRFLDLQKAEIQTREAQIELALERVRAKTMAMQHSIQLREIAATTLEQLQSLGFTYGACSIVIMDAVTGNMTWWISGFENDYPASYGNIYFEHPFYLEQLNNWKEGKKYAVMVCEGEAKKAYDEFIFSKTEFVKIPIELQKIMQGFEKITFSNAYMQHGALSWSTEPLSEEYAKILQRFAGVFEQSYTRFLDLQKAETQAREAQIEASLERIRSRAMAMNTSDELSTLIGFIYTEYTKLNMQLDRGFIMTFDPITKDAHWWMVSADAPDMPLKIFVKHHEHAPNLAILKGWEERDQRWSYVLEGNNKKTWDDYQFANSLAQLPDFVKDNMRSVKSVILNASFQNFGCIMLSSFEPLSEDHFDLLIRLSKVFDLTYIRFLDLQLKEQNALKLAEEKLKLELTLSELRSTQNQLIQSEKLASLGELTAGIAHEIQNPLNFVNNFAEVSAEMIDELKEELEKGDIEEVKAIAEDLQVNLGKINHHGGRASSIVKGMLEHSRTSTGVKEPTNLNALADEYLRLAYHGLRAKDNSFNATMETHFDPDLPVVSVIPQDIGRVLLNLINNAFYAVAERSRSTVGAPLAGTPAPYQPTVTVSTQKTDNQIIIKVQDNGNGIPEAIREKIFQPFFTTKPTGQGTGLGLSLAYDIVTKGHSGTLEVQSIQSEGTTFIIKVPFSKK